MDKSIEPTPQATQPPGAMPRFGSAAAAALILLASVAALGAYGAVRARAAAPADWPSGY